MMHEDSTTELALLDHPKMEHLRHLSSQRPNKALVRIDASVRYANMLARREADHRDLCERRARNLEAAMADKDMMRVQKAEYEVAKEERVRHTKIVREQFLEQKRANIRDLHDDKAEKRAQMLEEDAAKRQAYSIACQERTDANYMRNLQADQYRRSQTARRHEEIAERIDKFQDELANARQRAAWMKQERDAAIQEGVVQLRDRYNQHLAKKDAAYNDKMDRIDMKVASQEEAHRAIAEHNALVDVRVGQLEELVQRQIALGGGSQQLQAQIIGLRRELEDLAQSVPGYSGRPTSPSNSRGAPKYMSNVHSDYGREAQSRSRSMHVTPSSGSARTPSRRAKGHGRPTSPATPSTRATNSPSSPGRFAMTGRMKPGMAA